jgi:hypothetical protein
VGAANTWESVCEADHVLAVEGSEYVASDLFGDDEQANGHEFDIGPVPHVFLKLECLPKLPNRVTGAKGQTSKRYFEAAAHEEFPVSGV